MQEEDNPREVAQLHGDPTRVLTSWKEKCEELEAAGGVWKAWAEKEAQVKAGQAVAAELRNWQANGKTLPVETATSATQTDHMKEKVEVIQVDEGMQTETVETKTAEAEEAKQMETVEVVRQEEGNMEMTNRSDLFEDLSKYEEEDEIEKTQAAPRPAAKAGKKSRPAKSPPKDPAPKARAMVIHGVPCQRPMANIIQNI